MNLCYTYNLKAIVIRIIQHTDLPVWGQWFFLYVPSRWLKLMTVYQDVWNTLSVFPYNTYCLFSTAPHSKAVCAFTIGFPFWLLLLGGHIIRCTFCSFLPVTMHLAPGLRIPHGLPRDKDVTFISQKMLSSAVENEERRDHTDAEVDYSSYTPTPLHEVQHLHLSFQSTWISEGK